VTATFDPKKDAANLKKHGVSLAEGDGVLSDPLAVTIEDDSAEGEQRFVTLGANTFGSLMVVVWTPSGRRCSHHLGSETDDEGKKDV
jgi:uncharacterized DUF497 family protein